jgi:DNA-binding XRE family transcriptional regulator
MATPHVRARKWFGTVLRGLREEAGVTQRALAYSVGCRQDTISAIELGHHSPSVSFAEELLAQFGHELEVVRPEAAP